MLGKSLCKIRLCFLYSFQLRLRMKISKLCPKSPNVHFFETENISNEFDSLNFSTGRNFFDELRKRRFPKA